MEVNLKSQNEVRQTEVNQNEVGQNETEQDVTKVQENKLANFLCFKRILLYMFNC